MPVKAQDILNIPELTDREWGELEDAWRFEVMEAFEDEERTLLGAVEPEKWVRLPPTLRPAPMRPVPIAPSQEPGSRLEATHTPIQAARGGLLGRTRPLTILTDSL